MRRLSLFLLLLLPFTAMASAQSTGFTAASPDALMIQRASAALNPDMVVARMMMFDRDQDGRVAKSELPERMQNLLLGDVSGDEALDRNEIRGLAKSAPEVAFATVPGFRPGGGGGGYMFGDQTNLSTRSHVEGALDDLRLPTATRDQALAIVRPFMDRLEADALKELFDKLEGVLPDGQLMAFRTTVNVQLSPTMITPSQIVTLPDGSRVAALFKRGPDPAMLLNSANLPEERKRTALAVFEDFKTRLRPGDADRAALLDELKDVLSGEELENFGAALQRRPLVKANNFGVVGGIVTGNLKEMVQRIPR